MAESFYEKRRKELGVSSSVKNESVDFYESKRMDLGIIPDTRQKVEPPKRPTTRELVEQGKIPSMNPNDFPLIQQARQFAAQQPPQPPDERNKVERGLDYIFKENPVSRVLNYPFSAASQHSIPDAPLIGRREDGSYGNLSGLSARESFAEANPITSTGNETLDKVLGFTGQVGAYGFNPAGGLGQGVVGAYKAVSPVVDRLTAGATSKLPALGQRMAQEAAREGATAAAYAPVRSLIEGEHDIGDIAKRTALEGAIGLGAGAAFPLAGAGIRRVKDQLDFRKSINEFIERTQTPRGETEFIGQPRERIVQQSSSAIDTGERFARNFQRGEDIQVQYKQAIDDEFDYLKTSLKDRDGVEQGGVIKDPVTGEVIDRYGRMSNNPKWYQDFYAENGRVPTDKDLRELAVKRVNKGFDSEFGSAPAFRSKEIQDIDDELKMIQEYMNVADPETRNALEITANELRKDRTKLAKQLPDDVMAMRTKTDEPVLRSQQKQDYTTTSSFQPDSFTPDELPDLPQRKVSTGEVKPISRNDVIQGIKKNLDVVIDTGKLGTSNKAVRGIFKKRSEVIRTRIMHEIDPVTHEIGHQLEGRYKMVEARFNDEFKNILDNHSDLDIHAYQPSELLEEGFSEYMRLLMTDSQKALEIAPKFSQHFMTKLPPKVLGGLRATIDDISRWLRQDGFHSAMGKIDRTYGRSEKKFNYNDFYTKNVDDLNPLKLAMNALEGSKSHLKKTAEKNLYKTARLSRGIGERAKLAVQRGIYNEKGEKISEGLGDVIKELENIGVTDQELSTYLAVIHAQDLKTMGKQIPFTETEISATLSELDSKAMRSIQQRIMNYNNALLDLLVEGQVISKEAVNEMRKKYPNYVPFMRFFDDDLTDGFTKGGYGASKGFANLTNPIKRMSEEGSERTLIDPLESIVRNTFFVMNAAEKNKVGLQLLELSKIQGAGKIVEELSDAGASSREHIITVKADGKNKALKIRQPELYDAMLSLDTESTNSLVKFLGAATNVLRGGATLTPEFMVRNVMRDVGSAIVTVGFNPVNFTRGMFYALTPQLRKAGLNIKNNRLDEFISSGGAMSTLMSTTRDYTRETMREAFKGSLKQRAFNVATNPKEFAKMITGVTPLKGTLKALRAGSELSEFSTKLGMFDQRIRKGDSLKEAAYQARDLMDFNRAGSGIRQANRLIAFLNASIQGTDKLARSFKNDPVGMLTRGFVSLTLPTIGLHVWYSQMSDEQKKALENVPQWQKDLFFIVPAPNNQFVRIPKPFEPGIIFSTLADRIIRDVANDDPEAWDEFAKNAAATFTPPVVIQFFNPILEANSNYSFFRDAPIVPMGLQGLKRKHQYDIYTSETAKLISKGVDALGGGNSPFVSPKIIDNTIYGYTAGLGRYAVSGIDKGLNALGNKEGVQKPANRTEQNPFLSPFMAKTQGSGQLRNRFYDKWDELSKSRNSARSHPEETYDMLEYQRFNNAYKIMSEINTKYKEILNHPHLSPEDKRDRLDVYDKMMNDIAHQTLYPQRR